MDKMAQEVPQSFRGRFFRQDAATPKEQRILVLRTGVAGLQFHIENEAERKALDAIAPGTELLLFREPENIYDPWAIAVHLTKEDKLGFVTRFKNETIARLMDAGKKFIGVVDDPKDNPAAQKMAEEEARGNHRAPTENMAVPFSIYMIEEA